MSWRRVARPNLDETQVTLLSPEASSDADTFESPSHDTFRLGTQLAPGAPDTPRSQDTTTDMGTANNHYPQTNQMWDNTSAGSCKAFPVTICCWSDVAATAADTAQT